MQSRRICDKADQVFCPAIHPLWLVPEAKSGLERIEKIRGEILSHPDGKKIPFFHEEIGM